MSTHRPFLWSVFLLALFLLQSCEVQLDSTVLINHSQDSIHLALEKPFPYDWEYAVDFNAECLDDSTQIRRYVIHWGSGLAISSLQDDTVRLEENRCWGSGLELVGVPSPINAILDTTFIVEDHVCFIPPPGTEISLGLKGRETYWPRFRKVTPMGWE